MSTPSAQVTPSRSAQVVEWLLGRIARGDYPPDTALPPERDLAEQLAVSRITIREALQTLKGKGVVRGEQGRGTFVNPVARWSVFDPALVVHSAGVVEAVEVQRKLLEMRRIIEVGAAELAAARRTEADLEAMARVLERMRQVEGDVEAFVAADVEFHRAVMGAARNVFASALLEPIARLLYDARRQTTVYPEGRRRAVLGHGEIYAAIRAGSEAAAGRAMRDHLVYTEQVLERLSRLGAGEATA